MSAASAPTLPLFSSCSAAQQALRGSGASTQSNWRRSTPAAVSGTGVAISRGPLAAEYLAAGRLVRPFELELPSECAYYFVVPEVSAEQPKIHAFREWLLEEVATDAASPAPERRLSLASA